MFFSSSYRQSLLLIKERMRTVRQRNEQILILFKGTEIIGYHRNILLQGLAVGILNLEATVFCDEIVAKLQI